MSIIYITVYALIILNIIGGFYDLLLMRNDKDVTIKA